MSIFIYIYTNIVFSIFDFKYYYNTYPIRVQKKNLLFITSYLRNCFNFFLFFFLTENIIFLSFNLVFRKMIIQFFGNFNMHKSYIELRINKLLILINNHRKCFIFIIFLILFFNNLQYNSRQCSNIFTYKHIKFMVKRCTAQTEPTSNPRVRVVQIFNFRWQGETAKHSPSPSK